MGHAIYGYGGTPPPPPPPRPRYEYKYISVAPQDVDLLNFHGQNGWRVVAVDNEENLNGEVLMITYLLERAV